MLTGMLGNNVVQLRPIGIPTAQLAFRILFSNPPDDRLPAKTPHVNVHEGDITNGTSSKGCVLAALFAMTEKLNQE